jgi:hypothetical protein
MLVRFLSSNRARLRTTARARGPRNEASARGDIRVTAGDLTEAPLPAVDAASGTVGIVARCGSGGIFAALPNPLGSLTELLRPVPAPGPIGIPFTPAVPAPNDPAGGDPTGLCADDIEQLTRPASSPNTIGRKSRRIRNLREGRVNEKSVRWFPPQSFPPTRC